MAIFVIICTFSIYGSVLGEIYKWVDDKGSVHFTEDPSTIPEKFRTGVKSRMTEEDLMTPEERLRKKEEDAKELKERQTKEQTQYEKALEEERARKLKKQAEDDAYEKSLKSDKEEKSAKAPDVKAEEKNKEVIPKQRLVKCQNCMGGYIQCSWCKGKGGKYEKITSTQTVYSKCVYCSGTGKKECAVCQGKGVFLK